MGGLRRIIQRSDFVKIMLSSFQAMDMDMDMDIFYPKRGQKEGFFDHLPTSSFPRSFWTTPKVITEVKTSLDCSAG